MVTQKYGLVNFDEVEIPRANNYQNDKDLFLRLENGPNRMRIISKAGQYYTHAQIKLNDSGTGIDDNVPGFGERMTCAGEGCPVCAMGHMPKMRWYIAVIDRKENRQKLLDMSQTVFEGIQLITRMEEYGAASKYDIVITVNKAGGAAGYYKVNPMPPKPLSDSDLALQKQVDLEDIARRCQPITVQKARERLVGILAKQKKGATPKGAPVKVTKPVNVSVADVETDEEFVFTPVD